ncbi:plasmid segregation protein ParM (plasmid) [Pararobbsia alpina]|uniref:PRTRC system protein D n=1 Tax=Pararobbsia alpina TaxID=621374 RepID=UPI0039A4BC7B
MKANTVAIDVGYGNTKTAVRIGAGISTNMFPSLAPMWVPSALSEYGQGALVARNVKPIDVGGAKFEVGPDVPLTSAYGNTGRTLSEDFVTTQCYDALLGGALTYAGVREVERLVLGLPVHTTKKYSQLLKDRFTRSFDFGHGKVNIRSVLVVPQPVGALVAHAQYAGAEFSADHTNLIIDVGYFTTDWVVATGFAMDDRRSGGLPGGASHIYRQIASAIAHAEDQGVDEIERIDNCLRSNKPFFFHDRDIDLTPYLLAARPFIESTVKELQSRVGRASDIRSIVLAGGGSNLYEPVVRAAFPGKRIKLMDAPCYANVKGFLLVGESAHARERKKAAV